MRSRKNDYAVLAGLLRTARINAKLTQIEVATRLGVPQSFVSKYESGERRLDVLELRKVAAALDTSAQTIIGKFEALLSASK